MTDPYSAWRPPATGKTIGSAHVKGGGTTKTTAAILTGHAYIARGETVDVISFDYFHSAVSWADKAHEGLGLGKAAHRPWPKNYNVEPADTDDDLWSLIHGSAASRRIIDGGPADPESFKKVVRLSDTVILPTEPSYLTIEQVTAAFELVGEIEEEQNRQIDARVLLVRVNPSLALTKDVREALTTVNIPVMESMIRQDGNIARAAHTVPLRCFGYEKVVEELEAS
ncbi:hypothetical protein [Nocardia africana]|uniref:Flp pilus assembly protein, ATPase CpaE n=1 Tax=Nocardia africana TaxID=134964 RepID=A0A379X5P3_9NOCA|nr:hypothetical protein [Nocardia africana]MCC3318400.1 hypothetical protein [Nocardia africana]SUH72066.1 Uncharacterised protein [Nocardia africana]